MPGPSRNVLRPDVITIEIASGEGDADENQGWKDSQSKPKSKSLAVESRTKMAKDVESGGVATKNTKDQRNKR